MDEFERKLSVALKTATRDLPEHRAVTVTPVVRRRTSRLLLAAAVVVLLVAAVGGSWWALAGGPSTTPPADASCGADDVSFVHLPAVSHSAVRGPSAPLALIRLHALRSCSLGAPPALTLNGVPLPWDATPQDSTDSHPWVPTTIGSGQDAVFELAEYPVTGNPTVECPQRPPVAVSIGLTSDHPALEFDIAPDSGCQTIGFTTVSLPTATSTDTVTDTPCTTDDVTLAPLDVGGGGSTVGIEVVAKSACTLSAPPTVTLGGRTVPYVASATDHHDSTPWMPTSLAVGDHVSFSVTWAYVGLSCPPTGNNVSATASMGGTVLTDFTWFVGCAGNTSQLVLTPRATVGSPTVPACTAADVAVASTADTAATLTLTARDGATCVLTEPPTVLLDSTLAQYSPSVDPAARKEWQPRTLSPGHPAAFDVTFAETGGSCPPGTADHTVHVLVGGLPVDVVPWTAQVCGGVVVTVPH